MGVSSRSRQRPPAVGFGHAAWRSSVGSAAEAPCWWPCLTSVVGRDESVGVCDVLERWNEFRRETVAIEASAMLRCHRLITPECAADASEFSLCPWLSGKERWTVERIG